MEINIFLSLLGINFVALYLATINQNQYIIRTSDAIFPIISPMD